MHPVYNELHRILREQWLSTPSIREHVYTSRPNVSKEMFDRVGVCYCPPDTVEIVDELRKHFTLQELVDYSLIKIDDKPTVEYIPPSQRKYELTLKNRWVLPICDGEGHIQSFVGRALGDSIPKWKNLANCNAFIRGMHVYPEQLFNPSSNAALIMEGYVDTLSTYSYGYEIGVSIFGIQATDSQISKLDGLGIKDYILLPDGDLAGYVGILNTIVKLKSQNIEANIFIMENDGMDADEMGCDRFNELFGSKRLLCEKDYHPLELINFILSSANWEEEKTKHILEGGGLSIILEFANFFCYQFVPDVKLQLKEYCEKHKIKMSFKRNHNLRIIYEGSN